MNTIAIGSESTAEMDSLAKGMETWSFDGLSWGFQAMTAIMLIEHGDGEKGKAEGRKLVQEMAEKLDEIRETHLRGKAITFIAGTPAWTDHPKISEESN